MKDALHLRFEDSTGHQRVTVFMSGANCGQLVMKPEEAAWFNHICVEGCKRLKLACSTSGKPIIPRFADIDDFAIKHRVAG